MSKKTIVVTAAYVNLAAGILSLIAFILGMGSWVSCKVNCSQDGGYLLIWLLLSGIFIFSFTAIKLHVREVEEFIASL